MPRSSISFALNGKIVQLSGEKVFAPLSDNLRYVLGKTGTKVVCAEGDCGACTVMVSRPISGSQEFRSMNSCIASTGLLDGCHVWTVEGLSQNGNLTEVQDSMVRNCGGQCGFCTPGFVMAITHMYETKNKVSTQTVKNHLTGNLCRCTGYSPIVKAALDVDLSKHKRMQEFAFNQKLFTELANICNQTVLIQTEHRDFFAPTTMQEALTYLDQNANVQIFSGATDLGVQINKGKFSGNRWMSLHLIPDLYKKSMTDSQIEIHAKVSLWDFQKLVLEKIPAADKFLNIFASPQIKHTGTLIGNLANGSPIGDTLPLLIALDASLKIRSLKGLRTVKLADFYKGYKKKDLENHELIESVVFQIPHTDEKLGFYKVSQRRDLDISCVNAGFRMRFKNDRIEQAVIAYGGVGPTVLRLKNVENSMVGHPLNRTTADHFKTEIEKAITPQSDVRGTVEFRKLIAVNLFEKFLRQEGLV